MVARLVLAAVLAGAAVSLDAGSASAACSLNTFPIAVTMERMRPIVLAKIDGHDARFLLDSGDFYNAINAEFAADQKMKSAPVAVTGSHLPGAAETQVTGAGGDTKVSAMVLAQQFEFIGMTFKNVPFLTFGGIGDVTGVVGQNFLRLWDIEYDLGHGKIQLVTPKDCKDASMAYWSPGAAYSMLPMEQLAPGDQHTVGTVTVNGVKMRAIFDTGATSTFITSRAAARAGVKTSDPGVVAAGTSMGIDRSDIKTWVARFASVKIGDEEIKNGLLEIGDSTALEFDMLVGADFFLSHHVYVANSQRRIYFTYGGGPVFIARYPAPKPPAGAGQSTSTAPSPGP